MYSLVPMMNFYTNSKFTEGRGFQLEIMELKLENLRDLAENDNVLDSGSGMRIQE